MQYLDSKKMKGFLVQDFSGVLQNILQTELIIDCF